MKRASERIAAPMWLLFAVPVACQGERVGPPLDTGAAVVGGSGITTDKRVVGGYGTISGELTSSNTGNFTTGGSGGAARGGTGTMATLGGHSDILLDTSSLASGASTAMGSSMPNGGTTPALTGGAPSQAAANGGGVSGGMPTSGGVTGGTTSWVSSSGGVGSGLTASGGANGNAGGTYGTSSSFGGTTAVSCRLDQFILDTCALE